MCGPPAPRIVSLWHERNQDWWDLFLQGQAIKAVVRPFERADLDGVSRLRILVYPERAESYDVDWHSSIWRWLATHPLADQMHRWVVVTEGGKVVGHLAAIPQFYRIRGQRVVAHTPADYQVLEGYGFHAISLMRRFFRTVENCVAPDRMSAVISIEKRLGAQEVDKLHFAAKALDMSALPDVSPLIPTPVRRLHDQVLQWIDRVLLSSILEDDTKAEVLKGFDESFDTLFESIAAAVPCVPEKDAAFLRWRYGPGSPQSPVTVLGVRSGKTLLGYAVLWVSRGQNGHVLDLATLPRRREVSLALLREAVCHFRRVGVHSIRCQFLESSTSPRLSDLWRLGFFSIRGRRCALLSKFADPDLHKATLYPAHWSYSVGDGEASFWVR
jgi:hypothetical protein